MHSTLDIEQSSKHAIQIERKKNMKCWKGRKEEMKWKQSSNKDSRAMMERGSAQPDKSEKRETEERTRKKKIVNLLQGLSSACCLLLHAHMSVSVLNSFSVGSACWRMHKIYIRSKPIHFIHTYIFNMCIWKQQTRKRRVNALCVQNRFVEL